MKRNGAYYYYILNLQGDVIRLINSNGTTATVLANSLNAGWSLIVETVRDSFGTAASLLP
jgi:hypothetical protein